MANKKSESFASEFPIFALIVFILALIWLLSELKVIITAIPWLPVIAIVVAINWIIDFYKEK
ncbi:hypothetical protein KY361_06520 [Candidatus Woesearchaeota archaeon]|nr:hypothetical protein [Candidatus Woesearchaeota archaeon]